MALSPNGKILAIGDYATTLWDLSNPSQPAKLAILSGHEGASLAFSKDNKLLATGGCRYYLNSCMQGEIVIWDTSNPALPIQKSSLLLGTSKITSLAFSPDSPSLASTYSDGVMIWDISNPEAPLQQTSLSKNIETALSLAYSPDGKSLVSGDLNGTLILWNQDPNSEEGLHSWVKTACQIAGRNFTQTEWTQYFPDDEYRITCPQWPAGE
jgi:WD40 repeat protein